MYVWVWYCFPTDTSRADKIVVDAFMTVFAYLYGNYKDFLMIADATTKTRIFRVCASVSVILKALDSVLGWQGQARSFSIDCFAVLHALLLHALFLHTEK